MPIRPEMRAKYPPSWPAISLAVRERAGWACECVGECGHNHGDENINPFQKAALRAGVRYRDDGRCAAVNKLPHPITGSDVVLTVMHLDHNPENNRDGNLMAACQRCHLAYDADHHAETRRARKAVGDLFEGAEP